MHNLGISLLKDPYFLSVMNIRRILGSMMLQVSERTLIPFYILDL
jgi:hypothetical protein